MSKKAATVFGFSAVVLWSLLALLTAASGKIPPFQLAAMTFAIGGTAGALTWIFKPNGIKTLWQNWKVWLVGVGGLFGYHFMYFSALRAAPAIEASLIAYLWPLLIVVFSALLPGEKLKFHHLAGAALGFAGAALIVTGGSGFELKFEYLPGYGMAILAALIWSSYSIISRQFAKVPTDIVTGFCLATAMLATLCHLMLEDTLWPSSSSEWLSVLGLGLGPVGLAFYVWDIGVKNGDIQVLGALSYSAPLLSTLILIIAGFSEFTWAIGFACILITLGAIVASKEILRNSE